MFPIKCPACGAESKLFFPGHAYQGPFRCFHCRSLFQVQIEGDKMSSAQPMSEEDLKQQQEAGQEEQRRQKEIEELKARFMRRPEG